MFAQNAAPLWIPIFQQTALMCRVRYQTSVTVDRKWRQGTEKVSVFVALSLDECGNPYCLKMHIALNIKQVSVKDLLKPLLLSAAQFAATIIVATFGYAPKHKCYDPNSGLLTDCTA